ncbi:hypothetical protein TSAR_006223 [Trichomalopsis sarcophagae]|uniref:C2H2-type domain-containing protein n=1 Tax=Trichomalopsis sarcophagae TaxID=543379 RepID=A0A232F2U8_9HYME|nr:hypothetical protein TSAR_006223 [Trichomalopsis sarcophagae]
MISFLASLSKMGNVMCNVITGIFESIFALFIPTNLNISYKNNNVYTKGKSTCPEGCTVVEQKEVISYLPEQQAKQGESLFHKVYYCSSCKITLDNQNILKYHCMLHLHKKYSLDDIIQFKLEDEQIIINYLFCRTIMHSEKELARHLEPQQHIDVIKHFSSIRNIEKNFNFSDDSTNQILEDAILNSYNSSHIIDLVIKILCEPCQVMFQEPDKNLHIHQEKPCQKLMKYRNRKKKNNSDIFVIDHTSQNLFTCFICLDVSFNTLEQLFKHLLEEEHKYKMRIFKQVMQTREINNRNIMVCSYELSKTMKNIISKRKNGNTYKKLFGNGLKTDIQILNENFVTQEGIEKYDCSICGRSITSLKKLYSHISGFRHQNNLKVAKSKNVVETHYSITLKNTIVGRNTAPAFDKNVSSKSADFENVSFLQSYKSSLLINDELNELIDFDLDNIDPRKSIDNKISKRNTKGDLTSGYSLDKNKVANASKFIELCIKPGLSNIYHMNDKAIQLLQTGINLTIPINSEKRLCIPCHCKFFNYYLYDHLHCDEHVKNLCHMENVCFREPLTDSNFFQFYVVKYPNNWILCYACGTYGHGNDDVIINHISSESHILKSLYCYSCSKITFQEMIAISKNLWYYVHVYVCNICNKRFKAEFDFIAHLESMEHENNNACFADMTMKFGICPVCVTCWYGSPDFYSEHCLNNFHKRFLISNELMVPEMPKPVIELLNKPDLTVSNLLNESNKTINSDKDKVSELLRTIEEYVKPIYPKAKAYLHGSRLSHQGFLDSDVDIFLDCENNYHYARSKEQSEVYLNSVLKIFEADQDNWIIDEVLVDSRVPILKLRHIFTNHKCDISFMNGLSVEKSKLIKYYNISFPICRQLILFLKKWLHYCQLSGSTGINTYALSWFVIFYLQGEKIVPTVSQLIKKLNSSLNVAGWECATLNTAEISSTNFAFKDILQGFFLYYGTFDYQFNVVCPLIGESISKHYFCETIELPEEMKNYKRQVIDGEIEFFRFDSPMCIQDPVDHSQNITKAITKLQLRSFKKYCTESAVRLSNNETSGSE